MDRVRDWSSADPVRGRLQDADTLPDAYQMEPPSVQFLSNILHPNIYRDGKVCITTLQKPPPRSETNQSTLSSEVHWRPVLGVEQVYLSIISLLSDPNLDDPANAAAAAMMRDNLDDFKETIRAICAASRNDVPL